jgi:hypothetical protein
MYWNFVAIDGVIKNQINTQQDATLKGKHYYANNNKQIDSRVEKHNSDNSTNSSTEQISH